ncbi:hypothetical protein [Neiella holothuriorum]|nr:hypothetical protein [Neiella holothuriorum]
MKKLWVLLAICGIGLVHAMDADDPYLAESNELASRHYTLAIQQP